jgi:hypothetical protein
MINFFNYINNSLINNSKLKGLAIAGLIRNSLKTDVYFAGDSASSAE